METKKSIKADLEIRKGFFLQSGLIIALALTLVAFEWKSPANRGIILGPENRIIWDEDQVILTRPEPPKPKPAPPTFTRIDIKDNDLELPDYEVPDAGIGELDSIPSYQPAGPTVLRDETPVDDKDEVFLVVETMPEFPGGLKAMMRFLGENIEYPETAKSVNIQGTVHLGFVVEKDGSVSNITVLRSVGGGCDEEAVRVLKLMPRWTPGLQRTKPVRVSFALPIRFGLN